MSGFPVPQEKGINEYQAPDWSDANLWFDPDTVRRCREHDGPPLALPTREGIGMRLTNRIVAAEAGTKVDVSADANGLRISIGILLARR